MVTIVDYGLGNLGSIKNMVKRIGHDSMISRREEDIEKADKLILPGVGSFDRGIANLKEYGLWDILNFKVLESKTPILGICLGMQLMTSGSEEGELGGLGWINAKAIHFRNNELFHENRVPHMGWNTVSLKKDNPLIRDPDAFNKFYFVHSYYIDCKNQDDILCMTEYGISFVSGFQKENIFGVQFHPEKSHKYGYALLSNFMEL